MQQLDYILSEFATLAWGPWLLVLLLGGGLFFIIYSRLAPFRYFKHAINILRGKYDKADDTGDISHFQALSSALAGTIGMGNIAGVAIAIQAGGPGAVFWMWVTAFLGMTTKFFTCTLAVMYRGNDSRGHFQGGPMYVVTEGLGKKWKPLAVLFCLAGLFGCLPAFQSNQLVQVMHDVVFADNSWVAHNEMMFKFITASTVALMVAIVIFGGITRIGAVTAKVVPAMVVLYMLTALWILAANIQSIPDYLMLIVTDAFNGEAAAGGVLGSVIITGVRRAAFSNEAGIGTEALAHGAAKTEEPVREGLVAMLGPLIDTLIVCSITALIILSTGVWETSVDNGVTLTASAFDQAIPVVGPYILIICVLFFSISTMFTYSYYGTKCLGFLIGAERQYLYNYFYVLLIVGSALVSMDAVIDLIDGMYALMAIPTTVSALLLAPRVMRAARTYFAKIAE